jgi:hypothetical protein
MGVRLSLSHCGRNIGLRGTRKQESGEDYTTRSRTFVLFTKYYSGGQIKKNEMVLARGTCLGDGGGCIKGFGAESWGKEDSIKMDLKKWDGEARTGLIWLRIGKGGWRLWMR